MKPELVRKKLQKAGSQKTQYMLSSKCPDDLLNDRDFHHIYHNMLSHYQIKVKQIYFFPSVIVGYKFSNCSSYLKEVLTISYNLSKVDCFLITYKTHHGIPICKKNCYYATRSVHLLLNRDKQILGSNKHLRISRQVVFRYHYRVL